MIRRPPPRYTNDPSGTVAAIVAVVFIVLAVLAVIFLVIPGLALLDQLRAVLP